MSYMCIYTHVCIYIYIHIYIYIYIYVYTAVFISSMVCQEIKQNKGKCSPCLSQQNSLCCNQVLKHLQKFCYHQKACNASRS